MSEAKQRIYAKLAYLHYLLDPDDEEIQEAIAQLTQTIEDVVE